MNKLLPERLREFANTLKDDDVTGLFKSPDGGFKYCLIMLPGEALELADEIERDYIPRPRDNKGIPYNKGDKIWSIDPDTEYSAEVIGVNVNTLSICWEDGSYDLADPCEMQHEKPQPKVLGADKVEINDGDTVYRVKDGLKMKVIAVGKKALEQSCEVLTEIDGKGEYHYNGRELTHKEPDSLEKLRDDMKNVAADFDVTYGDMQAWVNRLSALIERVA